MTPIPISPSATASNPSSPQPSASPRLGGQVHAYTWTYQGQSATLIYETLGEGSPVLLLPALSTVSTRAELAGIAEVLAPHHHLVGLDWLGFGDSDRPALSYERSLYSQLLADFVRDCCPHPIAVIAAGHAAGYALHWAQTHSHACSKLLLIAPTWKGPLRAMGAPTWVAKSIRQLVRSPLLGQTLYALNTKPAFLKWMYQRHVYVDATQLTPKFMQQKHAITQQPGARYAPAAFVTGGLDPMSDRVEWLQIGNAAAHRSPHPLPIQILIAAQAPPQSKAEMTALADLPEIRSQYLPGSLGMHEEYAADVGAIALDFFQS